MKACSKCKMPQSLDCYHKDKNRFDGLSPWCKQCSRARSRSWYERNQEAVKIKTLNDYHQGDKRFRKYGLTRVEYSEMLKTQNGLCAICNNTMDSPHIDHCHASGEVRGLLCRTCNLFVGHLEKKEAILDKALAYLAIFDD